MTDVEVVIGKRPGECVVIRVHSRTELAVRDYWDANWVAATVSVAAGGWRGENAKAFLRTEELSRFRTQVERLHDRTQFDAELAPMEPHVVLRLRGEDEGLEISVTGTATDRLEGGNTLSFRFPMNRDDLPDLIAQLALLERAYPTIGKG